MKKRRRAPFLYTDYAHNGFLPRFPPLFGVEAEGGDAGCGQVDPRDGAAEVADRVRLALDRFLLQRVYAVVAAARGKGKTVRGTVLQRMLYSDMLPAGSHADGATPRGRNVNSLNQECNLQCPQRSGATAAAIFCNFPKIAPLPP